MKTVVSYLNGLEIGRATCADDLTDMHKNPYADNTTILDGNIPATADPTANQQPAAAPEITADPNTDQQQTSVTPTPAPDSDSTPPQQTAPSDEAQP